MEKVLYRNFCDLITENGVGVVGEKTSIDGVCVGDLVSYNIKGIDGVVHGIVSKDKGVPYYSIMGSLSTDIVNHKNIKVVIPHNLVTNEIANEYCITILEQKEMTLSEIEVALGYPVKIVK